MPLVCRLFTQPQRDPRLEDCLVKDSAHITRGTVGDHVKKIQTALNRLSAGPGRENFTLKVDGIYGPKTAAAVKAYKSAPQRRERIKLQPFQNTHDDIVGKQTIKSLDDEMAILENESPGVSSQFVSQTEAGALHNHDTCPGPPRVTGTLFQGRAAHFATPINPKGGFFINANGIQERARKVNIFGEGETDYLGFEDFAPTSAFANGRPISSDPLPPRGRGLPDNCASDVCIRSSPMNRETRLEIFRIARPFRQGGCRLTSATNLGSQQPATLAAELGAVIEHGVIHIVNEKGVDEEFEFVVVEIAKF